VHDRRVAGETLLFGNAGGLYKNAMTWYDHKTVSIWSQPTGEVLAGPLEGTKLSGLPFQLTTWGNWSETYPDSLLMANDLDRLGNRRQTFSENFLIGVELGEFAKAYAYTQVESKVIIEDQLGDFPILIWAEDQDYRVFLRKTSEIELNFSYDQGVLKDQQTGSVWNPRLGLAQEGDLKGEVLQQLPSFSIWSEYFRDFFPDGEIYRLDE
jgi:hypothetical protein